MAIDTTGKRIYELEPLTILKDEAYLATSQDNKTRKFQVRDIRALINGDHDEPGEESYYSSLRITELFGNTSDQLDEIRDSINNINIRIDDLSNTVLENYSTLDKRITKEVNTLNDRIDKEVHTLDTRITNEVKTLNTRIDTEVKTLNTKIDTEVKTLNTRIDKEVKTLNDRITTIYNELKAADTALQNRCTALETRCTNLETRCATIEQSVKDLNTKLQGWILYGNAAPTSSTLPAGRLYIQWF